MEKPTNQNLAKYYGFHFNTIRNFKKSRPLVYEVLKEHFIKEQKNQTMHKIIKAHFIKEKEKQKDQK